MGAITCATGQSRRGFPPSDLAAVDIFNSATGTGAWGSWVSPAALGNAGFGLPTRGQLAVYVQYAQWNGAAWEMTGEWGKVYNARGEHVSWFC